MKKFVILFAGLLFFGQVSTAFAQTIYLQLVKGSGQAAEYTPEIPLTSAQYSFSNVVTIGSSASGSGGGKATFAPLVVTKQVDGSSGPLQRSLVTGGHYQYARLNFYRTNASGGKELAYRVVVGTLMVAHVAASAAEGCTTCPALAETVTLEYGQVATYNPTTKGVVTWNRLSNTENVAAAIPTSAITQ